MTKSADSLTIAIVCDVLGKENNGTTIAAMNLIRSLREKGHRVRIVCADPERAGQEDCYIVPTLNLRLLNKYVARNGVVLAKPDKKILTAALSGADQVHIMLPFALGSAAARLARTKSVPLTAGFHAQAENITGHIWLKDFPFANRTAYKIFYRMLYRYCDCVHFPSQFICDTFEAAAGPVPHRIISNGVDPMFHPEPAEKPESLKNRFVVFLPAGTARKKVIRC